MGQRAPSRYINEKYLPEKDVLNGSQTLNLSVRHTGFVKNLPYEDALRSTENTSVAGSTGVLDRPSDRLLPML